MLAYGAYLSSTPEGQARATVRALEREATRAEQTSVAAIEATEEARPTDTPLPTNNSAPTNTPAPTDTPAPTNTPLPTDTPRPTDTPIPPTPTLEPIILTGTVIITNQPTATLEIVEVTNTSVPEYLQEAINVVANELDTNVLNIRIEDLLSKENPKGEGVFVYVEQTRFSGVERYIIWLVLDGTAYALNGATKDVVPSFLWPREAPEDTWSRTNLDMYQATEAIEIVFGE